VDDVAVMAFAFSFIKDDLENYRIWKMSNWTTNIIKAYLSGT
jgi:uncharacterized membrane protein YkvA (DUF1232 family)